MDRTHSSGNDNHHPRLPQRASAALIASAASWALYAGTVPGGAPFAVLALSSLLSIAVLRSPEFFASLAAQAMAVAQLLVICAIAAIAHSAEEALHVTLVAVAAANVVALHALRGRAVPSLSGEALARIRAAGPAMCAWPASALLAAWAFASRPALLLPAAALFAAGRLLLFRRRSPRAAGLTLIAVVASATVLFQSALPTLAPVVTLAAAGGALLALTAGPLSRLCATGSSADARFHSSGSRARPGSQAARSDDRRTERCRASSDAVA